ncbi:MAG: DUF3021 domain-containing protein [Clostridia bacterium]|nr:DUF3021 domain-containing protein [Clostridia bacterium]
MKSYVKEFFKRGMAFGGFGPIIAGIVFFAVDCSLDNFSLSGGEVLTAIIFTYLLAFVQAGASVFNQIEHWPITKSLLFHFLTFYVAYIACYLANSWIPFDHTVVLIFTAIFAVGYFVIWFTVYFIARATGKKLNKAIKAGK